MARMVLLFIGGWAGPLLASLLVTLVTAGVTSRWSAGKVGPVLLVLLGFDLVLFLAGSAWLWRGLGRTAAAFSLRAVGFGLHLGLQVATYVVLVLLTLLAFNR